MRDLITTATSRTVGEAVDGLLAALERRSITVFARIDHAEGARSVDMELPGETVVIFGNPRVGTPLMQADPTVGIELPLRILVWDDAGTTTIGHHDPLRLAEDHSLGEAATGLEQMRGLLAQLVAEAAG